MSAAVFFIGGWNAKPNHINSWMQSAQLAQPGIAFSGFPWPDGVVSWPDTAVVQGWRDKKQFQKVVDAVEASQADIIYIVGHSSGCAVANAVDKALSKALTDTSKIVLVALDGFAPDEDQRKRPSTQVWSALNGVHHKARNYTRLKKLLGSELHEFTAQKGCTSEWALNFSLVNSAATDALVQGVETGYTNCEANLIWMWTKALQALVSQLRPIL
jgi:hypothetical protein